MEFGMHLPHDRTWLPPPHKTALTYIYISSEPAKLTCH
jgi:hypothetical protein